MKRIKEEAPSTNTGSVAFPPIAVWKKANVKPDVRNVTDRRYRKDKPPVMLKRFREYVRAN